MQAMLRMAISGIDYPRSEREFRAWFQTGEDCLDYLDWLRWGDAASLPSCGLRDKGSRAQGGRTRLAMPGLYIHSLTHCGNHLRFPR